MQLRILSVDDSITIQTMLEESLRAAGHEVIIASDGIEGLELLSQAKVDLIISDVNMIKMGGFEFVSRVRQIENYRFTPILFLTTENSEEFRTIGREVGATGWLTKPFNPDQLLYTIRKVAA